MIHKYKFENVKKDPRFPTVYRWLCDDCIKEISALFCLPEWKVTKLESAVICDNCGPEVK